MKLFLIFLFLCLQLAAQELTNGASGTGLGKEVFSFRALSSVRSFKQDGDKYVHYHQQHTLAFGINSRLTIMGHIPLHATSGSRNYDGKLRLGDPVIMAKLRVLQLDHDSVSTSRLSLLMALEAPGFDNEISSRSFDPTVGFGLTTINGRHGLNLSSQVKINTGDTPYYEFAEDNYIESVLGYSWRLTPTEVRHVLGLR